MAELRGTRILGDLAMEEGGKDKNEVGDELLIRETERNHVRAA